MSTKSGTHPLVRGVFVVGVLLFIAVAIATRVWEPADAMVRALQHFTPAEIAAGRAYRTPLRWVSLLLNALVLVAAIALVETRIGARLADRLVAITRGRLVIAAALMMITLSLLDQIISLPFALFVHSYRTARGMTQQSWASFLGEDALQWAVMVGLGALITLALAWTAKRAQRTGWLWVAALVCVFALVGEIVFPVLVAPLFNRLDPIGATPFASQEPALRDLMVQGGVARDAPLLVADASRQGIETNAYVAGLLGSERVVLYDTLLAKRSVAIVHNTLGHELGHYRLGHVKTGLLAGCGGAFVAIALLWWIVGASRGRGPLAVDERFSPRAVILVVALIVTSGESIVLMSNAVSRSLESAADDAGLQLTGETCAFVEDEVAWAREAHADVVPHPVRRWFSNHPETVDRIDRACAKSAVMPACCRR